MRVSPNWIRERPDMPRRCILKSYRKPTDRPFAQLCKVHLLRTAAVNGCSSEGLLPACPDKFLRQQHRPHNLKTHQHSFRHCLNFQTADDCRVLVCLDSPHCSLTNIKQSRNIANRALLLIAHTTHFIFLIGVEGGWPTANPSS